MFPYPLLLLVLVDAGDIAAQDQVDTLALHHTHTDVRCKCVCPNPSFLNATHIERKLYIKNVSPTLCDCPNVVITSLYDKIKIDSANSFQLPEAFCLRCVCKYEQRNTAVIKFVVMMVMFVVAVLAIYLMFLILEPKVRHRLRLNYSIQIEEEQMSLRQYHDESSVPDEDSHNQHLPDVAVTTTTTTTSRSCDWGAGDGQSVSRPGAILKHVSSRQDRWKHQLAVQRKNIYEDRSILN